MTKYYITAQQVYKLEEYSPSPSNRGVLLIKYGSSICYVLLDNNQSSPGGQTLNTTMKKGNKMVCNEVSMHIFQEYDKSGDVQ